MKIALCTDSFMPVVDGVGRVVHAYAEGLARRGHEVTVITPIQPTGFRGGLPFEIMDYISVPVPTAEQYRSGIAHLDPHYMERIRGREFDIIHAHSPATAGREAQRLASRLHVPLIGTFHSKYKDDIQRYVRLDGLANAGSHIVAGFYRHCDEVWTVSDYAAGILKSYGYAGAIQIVRNGSRITAPDEAWECRARECFRLGSAPILLYVGQIDFKKGIRNIAEAAAALANDGRDFTLVFAGQGQDSEALRGIISDEGLNSRTVFTGHIYDFELLCGLYMAAELFVFPSKYDTAGLVVGEAAMMGTPSLVTAGTAPAEFVTDGVDGLVCGGEAADIAQAIDRYIFRSSAEERRRMGAAAQERIPLSWERVLDTVEARYSALAASAH